MGFRVEWRTFEHTLCPLREKQILKNKLIDVVGKQLWYLSFIFWMNYGQADFKHGYRGNRARQ